MVRTSLKVKYRSGLEGRKSPCYSKLNKKSILAHPIFYGFMTPKLSLNQNLFQSTPPIYSD
jgi:hypothetical protein